MQNPRTRTDLALEAHRDSAARIGDIQGAQLREFTENSIRITELNITEQSASDILCKPIGKYFTIELEQYVTRRETSFAEAVNAIAKQLSCFDAISKADCFLVACLGNKSITPDAIGSKVADSLIVTRHLKSSMPENFAAFSSVALMRTGVLGTTGIESADTLRAICGTVKPDCVIAVDALASSDMSRLCKTVQICDSGIAPGSGVGNNRAKLSSESLGVPVIAMGVPTVIDASAFTDDAAASGLFVTPRNIDELVASISKLLAYSLNVALHKGLTVEDIDLLIE